MSIGPVCNLRTCMRPLTGGCPSLVLETIHRNRKGAKLWWPGVSQTLRRCSPPEFKMNYWRRRWSRRQLLAECCEAPLTHNDVPCRGQELHRAIDGQGSCRPVPGRRVLSVQACSVDQTNIRAASLAKTHGRLDGTGPGSALRKVAHASPRRATGRSSAEESWLLLLSSPLCVLGGTLRGL